MSASRGASSILLNVKVCSARNLTYRDRATINPYVVLTVGDAKDRTGVRKNSGMRPFWNHKFVFAVKNPDADFFAR